MINDQAVLFYSWCVLSHFKVEIYEICSVVVFGKAIYSVLALYCIV